MGAFTVSLQVGDLARRQFIPVDNILVDTETAYSMFPESMLTQLGIEQEGCRWFKLADNRVVEYPVGHACIRLQGNELTALVVFAPDDTSPLLGFTALETFGLGLDTVNQRLVPVPGLLK
jgi:predicted aspartyl protease